MDPTKSFKCGVFPRWCCHLGGSINLGQPKWKIRAQKNPYHRYPAALLSCRLVPEKSPRRYNNFLNLRGKLLYCGDWWKHWGKNKPNITLVGRTHLHCTGYWLWQGMDGYYIRPWVYAIPLFFAQHQTRRRVHTCTSMFVMGVCETCLLLIQGLTTFLGDSLLYQPHQNFERMNIPN